MPRSLSKNWKLYVRPPAGGKYEGFRHLSSYGSKATATRAVKAKFGKTHASIYFEIVLMYLGEEINRWKNPNLPSI
jgi:hypothetical protein